MTRYAAGHDPLDFVEYHGDEFNYIKILRSPTEQEALVMAILTHWRSIGRDVALTERFPTEPEDA